MPRDASNDAVRAYREGSFGAGLDHIVKTPLEVVVSGDLAVETSYIVVTFGDQEMAGRDTLVWRRGEDGEWRISTDIRAMDQ